MYLFIYLCIYIFIYLFLILYSLIHFLANNDKLIIIWLCLTRTGNYEKKNNNNNNISLMMAFLQYTKLQTHCYGHNHVPVKNNIYQKHFLCRNNVSHAGQRGKYLCLQQCFWNNMSSFARAFGQQRCNLMSMRNHGTNN